ncbi:hypothetical protein C1645_811593, partial [Glomus cerebriforme]
MDVTIDASGSNGHNASNGTNGIMYGSNGGSAGQAGSGSNGGNIQVTLSSVPYSNEPGHINISGTKTYSNGHVEYINNDYHLGKTGLIHFISRGGRGGNGGIGGNGAGGCKGIDGTNATKYSDGTDGGSGGAGGSGGRGSSGGNGGNGGHIKISVSEHDAHLLMLIGNFDVSGGGGGARGYHGSGGSGGSGGRGGNSYSWTETIPAVYEYPSNNALTTYNSTSNRSVDATMYWRRTEEIDHYIRPTYTKTDYRCDYKTGMYIGDGSSNSNALTKYNGPPVEYLSSQAIKRYDRPGETDIHYRRIDEIRLHGRINPTEYNNTRLIEPAEPRLITPEKTVHHSRPGGKRGASGCNGYSPTVVLYSGRNGSIGTSEYGVINEYGYWE